MIQYKISVIIPLYNQEKNIKNCISTLKRQTIHFENLEVILINDGSNDNSGIICKKYADKYSNVIYLTQNNLGVSAARNQGIKIASGKYLFFLDADDTLEKHTIQNVAAFFDSVYDEVDLVTYPIETFYNGKVLTPHFRYKYLNKDGVYDLREYAYIGQTTMNIVVKNRFEENVLFDEKQTFSEDQKYCCEVLERTLKMGFCKSGKYIYYRSNNSSSAKLSGSCYIFEQCMDFFETLFEKYDEVPLAYQGLYANDIYWKLLSNILLPYHYEGEEYKKAIRRIRKLLRKCENQVFLEHPLFDYFEKFYLLRLKEEKSLQTVVRNDGFMLYDKDKLISYESSMEIVVTKMQCEDDNIEIQGFIKSVFLQFYHQEPTVCAIENNGLITRKLSLFDSAHCYYLSHEKTQKFKAFRYRANMNVVKKVRFEVGFGSFWFPTHFYFMPQVPFSHKYKRYNLVYQGCKWNLSEKNEISFFKIPIKKGKRIWLYYDCVGVDKDNGYYQFEHDIEKKDGIQRYYIITDDQQRANTQYKHFFVRFGSRKHKKLLEECEKIFTAYIEESNLFPYDRESYEKKSHKFQAQIIYLQHGVLHIIMPWKFSPEKILADKVVVSTIEEKRLFSLNGFKEKDLLETGMARFDIINRKVRKKKKVLYAPSWRGYLTGRYNNHQWERLDEKFLNSTFFREIQRFISSPSLHKILDEYGYQLDVRVHPIFRIYQQYLYQDCKNIEFVSGEICESEYDLFITDFSSYMYNFIYLGIKVINYIPDILEFKCGMNGYYQLNYPEEFWDEVVYKMEEVVDRIQNFMEGKLFSFSYCHFFEFTECRENLYKKNNDMRSVQNE